MLVGGCVRRETRFREIKGFVGGAGGDVISAQF